MSLIDRPAEDGRRRRKQTLMDFSVRTKVNNHGIEVLPCDLL